MRKRYSRSHEGRIVQSALVYTAADHGIKPEQIDHDAVKVVRRLQQHGYEAYIVGGAVRDLLLGKSPKDFDVSCSATPAQIRKIFRNSRVIGKRFRLVHILFRDKIIEVSTFRSCEAEGFKNVYGSIEEDVQRRDFTANALFLDPLDNRVIDYVGGVEHIRKRVLQPVIPLSRIFCEDPVRIIRAVKYAQAGSLRLPWRVTRRIKQDRALLAEVPSSRMTEELFKILSTGSAGAIIDQLLRLDAFRYILPVPAELALSNKHYRQKLLDRLEALDRKRASSSEGLDRKDLLCFFCADYLLDFGPFADQQRIPFREGYYAMKEFLQPVTPANKEVEAALREIFRNKGRLLREEPAEYRDDHRAGRHRRRRPRKRSGGGNEGGRAPSGAAPSTPKA
ncbi:poly(A) polymerase [Alkalispirochaeta americana]|uniref:Poly(A) polymerase n=1 Tax=Alkalispirochaeta americana TaxID=159291 RepID=A0A1N6NA86_9SPIO|nr:polynucleotide adenylyltransferase PcnB [Alkalispirochaeta americana]SIP89010.1 poly(A) polymerase [Alkalispirochaeta americana]